MVNRKSDVLQHSERKSGEDRQREVNDGEQITQRGLVSMESGHTGTDHQDEYQKVIDHAVGKTANRSMHHNTFTSKLRPSSR